MSTSGQPSFSYCISTAISNAILIISRSCFLCSRSSTVWEMARRKRWCTPLARHSSSASCPLCPQVHWKRLDIWWSHWEHRNQWRDSASLFSSLHQVRKYFSISQVCSCSIYGWRGICTQSWVCTSRTPWLSRLQRCHTHCSWEGRVPFATESPRLQEFPHCEELQHYS